jgi:spore germination protein KA
MITPMAQDGKGGKFMLGWIKKQLKTLVGKSPAGDPAQQLPQEELEEQPLVANLSTNLERLKDILGESLDIVYRQFWIGLRKETKAAIVYLDAMVDKNRLQEFILRPLMVEARTAPPPGLTLWKALDRLKENTLTIGDVKEAYTLGDVVKGVLDGNTAILLAGETRALVAETRSWEGRAPEEPISEAAVRGPREGFTETLQTNIAMLRRRLKSSRLRMEHFTIGRVSRTDVVIAYLKGIALPQIIDEVRQRLERIDIDGILESGYIEELIEDHPSRIFSLVTRTERPYPVHW